MKIEITDYRSNKILQKREDLCHKFINLRSEPINSEPKYYSGSVKMNRIIVFKISAKTK